MSRILVAAISLLCHASAVQAGSFDDAFAEFDRGNYVAAREQLLSLAEQGDVKAQSLLAYMYSVGKGMQGDDAEAAMWYRRAADQGAYEAQAELAFMYSAGSGVPQDYVSAYKWCTIALNHEPEPKGLEILGANALHKECDDLADKMTADQTDEAINLVREWQPITRPAASHVPAAAPTQSASLDDALAAGYRGDYATKLELLLPLAEHGDAVAQSILGAMYRTGEEVPRDDAAALRWNRHAAEQGNTVGQRNLAGMYEEGTGVPQDYVEAHKWYNLAAASGLDTKTREVAQSHRETLVTKMTPAQIADAQKRARDWKPAPISK